MRKGARRSILVLEDPCWLIDTITSGHGIGNGWFAREILGYNPRCLLSQQRRCQTVAEAGISIMAEAIGEIQVSKDCNLKSSYYSYVIHFLGP